MPNEVIMGGDIVQIIDETHPWFGVLLIVQAVKTWGVVGYVPVAPFNGDDIKPARTTTRLDNKYFAKVGHALIENH